MNRQEAQDHIDEQLSQAILGAKMPSSLAAFSGLKKEATLGDFFEAAEAAIANGRRISREEPDRTQYTASEQEVARRRLFAERKEIIERLARDFGDVQNRGAGAKDDTVKGMDMGAMALDSSERYVVDEVIPMYEKGRRYSEEMKKIAELSFGDPDRIGKICDRMIEKNFTPELRQELRQNIRESVGKRIQALPRQVLDAASGARPRAWATVRMKPSGSGFHSLQ